MKEIPTGDGNRTVYDNLIDASKFDFYTRNKVGDDGFYTIDHSTLSSFLRTWFSALNKYNIPWYEKLYPILNLAGFITSCEQRRKRYDKITWEEFILPDIGASDNCHRVFERVCRLETGGKEGEISALSVGVLIEALALSAATSKPSIQILNSPLDEAWIKHWKRQLKKQGVDIRLNSEVKKIVTKNNKVQKAFYQHNGKKKKIEADQYILSMSLDGIKKVTTNNLKEKLPVLEKMEEIKTTRYSTVFLYLNKRTQFSKKLSYFPDSPWVLSVLRLRNIWGLDHYHDSGVQEVLSVLTTQWDECGTSYSKEAQHCTKDE